MPFSLIYHRPTGGAEIITAVTPLSTPLGCWAVVASFSEKAFPSSQRKCSSPARSSLRPRVRQRAAMRR
jgi:hypothetical protein